MALAPSALVLAAGKRGYAARQFVCPADMTGQDGNGETPFLINHDDGRVIGL